MPTNRSAKEFACGVRTGVLIARVPFPAKDFGECRGELAVPVTDQEPEPAGALAEVHEKVTGPPDGPDSRRIGGDAQDLHGPGLDLHHEEDIHAPEQHGIDMQKVAGQDLGNKAE